MGAWRSALPSHLHLLAWKSRTNNPITPIQQATVFVCEEGGGGGRVRWGKRKNIRRIGWCQIPAKSLNRVQVNVAFLVFNGWSILVDSTSHFIPGSCLRELWLRYKENKSTNINKTEKERWKNKKVKRRKEREKDLGEHGGFLYLYPKPFQISLLRERFRAGYSSLLLSSQLSLPTGAETLARQNISKFIRIGHLRDPEM